ncbi:MAG: hypothetical protein GY719_20230 [bacterium]|nr:hypothetical protein [bacterium]
MSSALEEHLLGSRPSKTAASLESMLDRAALGRRARSDHSLQEVPLRLERREEDIPFLGDTSSDAAFDPDL